MYMRSFWALLTVSAMALTAVSCKKESGYKPTKTEQVEAAEIAPGDEASIFPIAVGNQWVYERSIGERTSETTLKILSVDEVDGGQNIEMEVTSENGDSLTSTWRMDDTGIYQLNASSDQPNFEPAQILVPFPLEAGNEFTQDIEGIRPDQSTGPMKLNGRVNGAEEVDLVGKSVSAFSVKTASFWETEGATATSIATSWWAPGIGFVRQHQVVTSPDFSATLVFKLKSYSFKD